MRKVWFPYTSNKDTHCLGCAGVIKVGESILWNCIIKDVVHNHRPCKWAVDLAYREDQKR